MEFDRVGRVDGRYEAMNTSARSCRDHGPWIGESCKLAIDLANMVDSQIIILDSEHALQCLGLVLG